MTDPFNPIYKVRDENNNLVNYGDVERSKPKQLHSVNEMSKNFSLTTQDIKGAQPDTLSNIFIKKEVKKLIFN